MNFRLLMMTNCEFSQDQDPSLTFSSFYEEISAIIDKHISVKQCCKGKSTGLLLL